MEAIELRLGNYVMYYGGSDIPSHREVDLFTIDAVLRGHSHDFGPIPLTYSWMKKLGFDTMDYEVDVIEWGMSDDPYFSIEQAGVPPEDKPYMFTYDVGMGETEIEVKYVHELQNLYFAIKRKELAI